ncbi:MAG: glutaredoxin family protein [Betaproteobacteria bacterium]|nr:glutaredoxin family protein [Betaproteobacteria bacterium]
MSPSTPVHLIVYLRPYCHLCHDLIERLRCWPTPHTLHIETIDIDSDPQLEARYNEWVPVLTDASHNEICHHFLDEAALTAYLAKIR